MQQLRIAALIIEADRMADFKRSGPGAGFGTRTWGRLITCQALGPVCTCQEHQAATSTSCATCPPSLNTSLNPAGCNTPDMNVTASTYRKRPPSEITSALDVLRLGGHHDETSTRELSFVQRTNANGYLMAGIGFFELLIVGLFCLVFLIVPLIVVVVLLMSRGGKWKPPEPAGPPAQVRALGPDDAPVSSSAAWHDGELEIRADNAGTISLFDVTVSDLQHCMILYRFRIKTDGLASAVYPEMWCRVPDKGRFFSRGLDKKVRGTTDWQTVEIPFYLSEGQRADLLNLNLVFLGSGTVRLKDIEVLAAPLKA